ncbi:putative oligosaccharyltransferase subunit ribophorin ii [Erysiphe necator]|uniref:Putative oligosaccharyltransferase subunit ribophorin ii n=1 Tax=Uncinula necator TaxID=52586 RepID=A0A0B1PH92_UNCNE|nr:putative oligosaccharyltransferase subunit ribophorin ii [Erysiphe necator]
MRFRDGIFFTLYVLGITSSTTASTSWNFNEAIISVAGKGYSSSKVFKDKLSDHVPLANPVKLTAADTLKITLTAVEDGITKRPHQAMLLLRDQDTGLEVPFSFSMMANGKGKVEFTQKNFPMQLNISSQPLRATLLLASFGSSQAFSNHVFNLDVKRDSQAVNAAPRYEKPLRYGKLEGIDHIFKPEPKSGPIIISIIFLVAVAGSLPVLLSSWVYLGANLSHLPQAIRAAPIAHTLFFVSILAMEFILFLYYYNWTLFQVLPVAGIISLIAIPSGPKALSEVQSRRLVGER